MLIHTMMREDLAIHLSMRVVFLMIDDEMNQKKELEGDYNV